MPFLEVTNIHKEYAGTPLLRGATFTVERGEIACLLGPSGSGKTTLLRLLAGLESASAGQIRLAGQELAGIPTHRRGIVLMFQEYALFPHKTVAENIAFGLQDGRWRLRTSERQAQRHAVAQRVAEMLALVGLEEFGEREVISLSGGEQQRVALARSLAPHPRLLLLDEPLGALDRNLRERLMAELPAILHRVGVTALTVTHDQEEAFALADRVILLHEGRVVQTGRPEEVYRAPADAWVAQFLGLTNLVAAQVVSQQPARVQTRFGELTLAPNCALP
ncbi:MAG: ABC transporter ATP-binding protein, partial [Chloroflexota bacterium]|nr:ABC transporter ATP-binding protein [Chloroflexota bacterium]